MADIYTLAVPTKDRPQSLERCVESYVCNAKAHGRKIEVVVVDGSGSSATRNENKAVLTRLRAEYRVPVFYAGPSEVNAYMWRLIGAGIPEEVVRFTLAGTATGTARNAILLDGAGTLLLSVDDDTVCELGRPPTVREGRRMHGARVLDLPRAVLTADPTVTWFFEGRQAAYEAAEFANGEDFFGLVGGDLGQVPEGASGAVRVVQAGLAGDIGAGSSGFILFAPHLSHIHLNSSPGTYRLALRSRSVLRAAVQESLVSGTFFMPHMAAMDLRSPLPPFFPSEDNPDGTCGNSAWGLLFGALNSSEWSLHLPWVVKHDPPEERAFTRADMKREAASPRVHDVVAQIAVSCQAGGASATYESVGRRFRNLGSLQPVAFDSVLADEMERGRHAAQIFAERYKKSSLFRTKFWLDDIETLIRVYSFAGQDAEYHTPADLMLGRTPAEARLLLQELLFKYGELLLSWEHVFAVAKKLRAARNRVGIPL